MIEEEKIPYLRAEIQQLSPDAVAYFAGLCYLSAAMVVRHDALERGDALSTSLRARMNSTVSAYTRLSHAFHGRKVPPAMAERAEAIVMRLREMLPARRQRPIA